MLRRKLEVRSQSLGARVRAPRSGRNQQEQVSVNVRNCGRYNGSHRVSEWELAQKLRHT